MFFDKDVEVHKDNKFISEKELYQMAKKRVAIKKGFAIHAGVYCVVNLALFAINMTINITAGASFPWFLFPALGWGIGLGSHYVAVVAKLKFDLKNTAIQREMEYLAKHFNNDKNPPL
jgi:hypothetical protein